MKMMRGVVATLFLIVMSEPSIADDLARNTNIARSAQIFSELGHSAPVMGVAFSPDGRTIATASQDKTIKLWKISGGRELRTLRGHNDVVNAIAFSPDGRTIVSVSGDLTSKSSALKIWDAASGRELLTKSANNLTIHAVAFSPDGRSIATGGGENLTKSGFLKIWEAASGRELRTLNGHASFINTVAFSPDGRTIASGSSDTTIKIWSASTGRELQTLQGNDQPITALAFSPDGSTIVSSSGGPIPNTGTLKKWDVASGRELSTLSENNEFIHSIAFSPDGRTIVSGGGDLLSKSSVLKIWNASNGREILTLNGHNNYISSVAFSPDGNTIVSGSSDRTIKLWNASSGREQQTFGGHFEGGIMSVEISPDGRSVVSGSQSKTLTLWNADSGLQLRTLSGHSKGANPVAFSPDGRTIVSGSSDKTIKLWDASSGRELRTLIGHNEGVSSVTFSPDGRTILSGSKDATIKLWDVSNGQELRSLSAHNNQGINSAAFSPDGHTIATGSGDFQSSEPPAIKIWDTDSGKELLTLSGHKKLISKVAFSPDGRTIASASWDKTIKIWDASNGRELRTLVGHTVNVRDVAFSPDGRTIVSAGGMDKTIKLWDVTSGRELRTLTGHDGYVLSVKFTPDGKNLISGSMDGTVRRWDINTGREIAQFVTFPNGEWVTVTPEGYYVSSSVGSKYINIRLGDDVYGIGQFYDVFYRPDIVQAKLRGNDISDLITITLDQTLKMPPPILSFTKAPSTTKSNTEKICYKAVATGGGIGEVRLFQNGKLIKSDGFYRETVARVNTGMKLAAMDSATVTRALKLTKTAQNAEPPMVSNSKGNEYSECQEIETIPGDNEISLAAFNANNTIQSALETIHFTADRKAEAPHLYVLGIGINQYTATENNLAYAVKDATDFRSMIQDKAKGLFDAKNIHIEGLSDAAATKVGIQKAIAAISAKVKPWDSFILFVASHGYLQDNQYYIVTSDFDGAIDTSKMISSNEIVGMSKNIKSLSQLLIFDTCHAGGVDNIIGGLYDARMSVMAKKMGLHIYASAGSTQTALDGYKGNGLFTHALLGSMKNNTTDSNRDSEVSVAELGERAKQETMTISTKLGFPQSPNIINFGKDNALFRIRLK